MSRNFSPEEISNHNRLRLQSLLFQATATGDMSSLKSVAGIIPKKNCKKCYGVGHKGLNKITGRYLLCSCLDMEK